ncbi:hypothetical protein MTO96_040125 [Rhipicephalus appendiculatus]
MDPSQKHCDCQFCPECQSSIPEDLQAWLQQQPDPKKLDEQKRESEEAEEPGCPDAALLELDGQKRESEEAEEPGCPDAALVELDEQKRESEEAEEPGCPDATLLVTKASASADKMGASAIEFRPGGSGSSGSTESSPKMDTPDIDFGLEAPNSYLRMMNTIPPWVLHKARPDALDLMGMRLCLPVDEDLDDDDEELYYQGLLHR